MTQTVKQAVHLESTATPATQMVYSWQRQLTPLPDPTRDGSQTYGLPGQMFLIGSDSKSAEANGDLTIVVYDETTRQPGTPAMRPEVWHYTKDTLKRLATQDERFGKCFALFLPWPAHWRDVTTVKVLGRYQAPGNPDLYAQEQKVTLDPSGNSQVWTETGNGSSTRPAAGSMLESRTMVPDGNKILSQVNASGQPAQQYGNPGTTPGGSFNPPTASNSFPPPQLTGFPPSVATGTAAPTYGSNPPSLGVVPQPTMPVWPLPTSVPMTPASGPTVIPAAPLNSDGPLQPIIIKRGN